MPLFMSRACPIGSRQSVNLLPLSLPCIPNQDDRDLFTGIAVCFQWIGLRTVQKVFASGTLRTIVVVGHLTEAGHPDASLGTFLAHSASKLT